MLASQCYDPLTDLESLSYLKVVAVALPRRDVALTGCRLVDDKHVRRGAVDEGEFRNHDCVGSGSHLDLDSSDHSSPQSVSFVGYFDLYRVSPRTGVCFGTDSCDRTCFTHDTAVGEVDPSRLTEAQLLHYLAGNSGCNAKTIDVDEAKGGLSRRD
jgi:hypothetical protein